FPSLGGWRPPVRRSEIERFDLLDAEIVLYGEETIDALRARAAREGKTIAEAAGHGYHRAGLGIKSSEFPPGWGAEDVRTWVQAIINNPTRGNPALVGDDFFLYGSYRGVPGALAITYSGRWIVGMARPTGAR
ncbi:MAG: hypothetical protein FWF28_07835, partial [Micrococcales bacterium]|nr:hypothetical protein [Micrococcales bacterium]